MKLSFYQKQNQLDEMQEQTLRKIESRSFWLLWWGLLALIAFQQVRGISPDAVLGELLIFTLASVYIVGACLRNGIWDRHVRPTFTANLTGALIGGGATAALNYLRNAYWPGAPAVRPVHRSAGLFRFASDGGHVQKTPPSAGKHRGGKL